MGASRRVWAPRPIQLVSLLVASIFIHGCSLVLDVEDEQCSTDADCVGLFGRAYACNDEQVCVESEDMMTGDAGGDDTLPLEWRCSQDPPRPIIPKPGVGVTLRIAAIDYIDLMSPPGVVGRACNPTDLQCMRPRVEDVMPDEEGYLVFEELPHAWLGFIELNAPGYMQTVLYTNRAYTADRMPEGSTMITRETAVSIAEGGGEVFDPENGIVLLAIFDCEGKPAAGITLLQDDESSMEHAFYFEGSLPDRDRNSTVVSRLLTTTGNPLSVAGFSQIKQGYVTMVLVHEETGIEVGKMGVQVRPLTMTIAEFYAGY
jgi:hypothetical protein